jgi:hypothetical protein
MLPVAPAKMPVPAVIVPVAVFPVAVAVPLVKVAVIIAPVASANMRLGPDITAWVDPNGGIVPGKLGI